MARASYAATHGRVGAILCEHVFAMDASLTGSLNGSQNTGGEYLAAHEIADL